MTIQRDTGDRKLPFSSDLGRFFGAGWLGWSAMALVLTITSRHGECREATKDMTEYENQLAELDHQIRDKWEELKTRGSIVPSEIDQQAVATDLAGIQHDLMWRPGFLNDIVERELKRAKTEGGRELSRDEARRIALAESRLKPIPGHEHYSSLADAQAAAGDLRADGEQGISVEEVEESGETAAEQPQVSYAVCQNINTESENINAKLNYKLNGALTTAYVEATVKYLETLVNTGVPIETVSLPKNLGTLQGKLIHVIWMKNNRWELTYNVLPESDDLAAKFRGSCGKTDAEQVEVDKIVEFVSGLAETDYGSLEPNARAKLLQFRPYDDIGRREQVKDDIVGMHAVLLIFNGLGGAAMEANSQ
jgi:hypothetical protein